MYVAHGTRRSRRERTTTVHEPYDTVRSQTGRCQSAPDNPETGNTNQSTTRGRSRAGIFGGGCQREKRPKMYQQAAERRRLPSQQKHDIVHNNCLGLQQTAAAATSCHRWLLLQHVAVLRRRKRLSERMWYRLRPHGALSSIIIVSRVERL